MDGDTPCDLRGNIADLCGADWSDKSGYNFTADLLNKSRERLAYFVNSPDCWDETIALQVWGRLVLEYGADLDANLKQWILKALEADEWAQTDARRKERIDAFHARVTRYDGKPQKFYDSGLLGAIHLHIHGVKPEAFAEGECPVCENGTIEETDFEFRCRGECGHVFPKKKVADV
jgi:hypothetical protein